MNCAVFGYVQQSLSQPCPAPGMTVGKSIQEKNYLLPSVSRLKVLTNLILQKCSLQEKVHKRGHIIFKKKRNAGYRGRALRGIGFKEVLWYSWKEWWKCLSWKRKSKGDSTKAVGEVVGTSKIVEGWEAKLGCLPKRSLVGVQATISLCLQSPFKLLFSTQKSISKLGKTTLYVLAASKWWWFKQKERMVERVMFCNRIMGKQKEKAF